MKDYRALSPCERVAYYEAQIRRLTPPASSRERLLIAAFEQLVEENRAQCGDGPPSARGWTDA
jgi:hypothetical protein